MRSATWQRLPGAQLVLAGELSAVDPAVALDICPQELSPPRSLPPSCGPDSSPKGSRFRFEEPKSFLRQQPRVAGNSHGTLVARFCPLKSICPEESHELHTVA